MRNFHVAAMFVLQAEVRLLHIFPRAVRRIRGVSLKPNCTGNTPQSVGAEGPEARPGLATGATLGAKFMGGCKSLILVLLIKPLHYNVFNQKRWRCL